MAPSAPLVKCGESLHTVLVEEKPRKRIFIDGRGCARLEDVPPERRAADFALLGSVFDYTAGQASLDPETGYAERLRALLEAE